MSWAKINSIENSDVCINILGSEYFDDYDEYQSVELDTANKANRNWLEGMVAPTDGMLNFPGILRSL